MGLRGADIFDGGGGVNGKDFADYYRDADFGGTRGIIADLNAGTVRDGFGQTDTLINIDRIIGTNNKDSFLGNAGNNVFAGLDGKDSFDGGAGFNTLGFNQNDWNGGLNGVTVDLSKALGQIVNDGYGNKENATGFLGVNGTQFGNSIKGNGGDNWFWGGQGANSFVGRGGHDTFEWDQINEFGDTVSDFVSGTDQVDFEGLEGEDGVVRFENNNHSTLAGPAFYFNAADHNLYYDRDGSGAGFAGVSVVTLTGVTSMTSADITIFV